MAHKKAAGSAKNLRDSQPKYRGVKLFGGQKALAGNIIIRQKGSQYECGENTYLAADFTIHALVDGVVVFKKKNFKRFDGRTYLKTVVHIFPETAFPTPQSSTKKAEKKAKKVAAVPLKAEETEKQPSTKKPATKKEPVVKKASTPKKEVAPKKTISTAKKSSSVKKPSSKKASSNEASA
ncbi:MAG: bL27 family ribosomal protein [Candidatus Peribacteria bacterium]|jgi:large subunit ribosomal protein L27|nr:bL27 family ribosomal protein [Candidatus Peribacteria bacterium]